MVGADASDLRMMRANAIEARDIARIGYIDEWVRELFEESQGYDGHTMLEDCTKDCYCSYRVVWTDVVGYTGVDYFDTFAEAMLCFLCIKDMVCINIADLTAATDVEGWWYCDYYSEVEG